MKHNPNTARPWTHPRRATPPAWPAILTFTVVILALIALVVRYGEQIDRLF